MFSPTRDAPWAPGRETGRGQQHPETIAVRSVEGGNTVDEGTLARADCEANLAHQKAHDHVTGMSTFRSLTAWLKNEDRSYFVAPSWSEIAKSLDLASSYIPL